MTESPGGTWSSPVTPRLMAAGWRRLGEFAFEPGATGRLCRVEQRAGTGVLVLQDGLDAPRDLTTIEGVRGRIGYGGGELSLSPGLAAFAAPDGRIWSTSLSGGFARPLHPALGTFAAPALSPDGSSVLCVNRLGEQDGLALIPAGGGWPRKLHAGADFYADPVWHPDGRTIAWIAWDHPDMPWTGARLHLARLSDAGELVDERLVAGGPGNAVSQPRFSPCGRFIGWLDDRTGLRTLWWAALADLAPRLWCDPAGLWEELGRPGWVLGERQWDWLNADRTIAAPFSAGRQSLFVLERGGGASPLPRSAATDRAPTWIGRVFADGRGGFAATAATPTTPPELVAWDASFVPRTIASSGPSLFAAAGWSHPEAVSWTSEDGASVHGLLWHPGAPGKTASTAPPLLCLVHGGPTSMAETTFDPEALFWTSRGYAVLRVNYRGSSGYGRAYQDALDGRWGELDADDATSGCRHAAAQGWCDPRRMAIAGGSSGGYTVLRCLTRHPGFFAAGICSYGISDLRHLVEETHKFELHYLDRLIGPLPQAAPLYRERSPLFQADRIRDPLLLAQGDEDEVVPRAQSDRLVEALRRGGIACEYLVFAGEGHGWRKTETIESFYSAAERFLRRHVALG